MNKEIAKKWCDALRSGDYIQGKGKLYCQYSSPLVIKYCGLGVLCDLHSKETNIKWSNDRYLDFGYELPPQVMKWAGLKSRLGRYSSSRDLMSDNDELNLTFSQIADVIEANVDNL